jgi:hypothetical protein
VPASPGEGEHEPEGVIRTGLRPASGYSGVLIQVGYSIR